jgi:hypothetical protein
MYFGSLGLRYDQRRGLAAICTLIAGGFVIFYLFTIGLNLFCR